MNRAVDENRRMKTVKVVRKTRTEFRLGIGALLCIVSLDCAIAAGPEIVRLRDANNCSIAAVYKKEHIGVSEVNAHGGVIIRDNVKFTTQGGSECLVIRALVYPVKLESDGLAGFSCDLPGSNQVSCCFCNGRGILDMATPAKNTAKLDLTLPDGATASLLPGTTARLDFFKDETYTLTGPGRAQIRNAEGKSAALDANSFPMTGGPVRDIPDSAGVKHPQRLSPRIALHIGAMMQGDLSLRIGDADYRLPPAVEKDFTIPNGASIHLTHDSLTGLLTWKVIKGYFAISFDGVPGWSAAGLSESAGTVRWNPFSQMVDFRNVSPEPVAILLPFGILGSVEPTSTLRYEAVGSVQPHSINAGDSSGFSITAPAGGAHLHDPVHDKTYDCQSQNLLFFAGFNGEYLGLLTASAPDGFTSGENFSFAKQGDLQAVILRSLTAPIKVDTGGFGGLSGELPGSNEVTCCFYKTSGIIEFSTPGSNSAKLALKLPDGGTADVNAGSTARFDIFPDNTYSLEGRGRVEAANGDGQKIIIAAHSVPMVGGPLITVTDNTGLRMRRASPLTLVRIGGWNQSVLSINIAGKDIQLPATATKDFAFPNGSVARFSQDPKTGLFIWSIVKGDFAISVEQIPGWKAAAVSGGSGEMHWDLKTRMIDLRNTSSDTLVVSLPSRTVAVMESKSVFQYAAVDDFMTTSAGAATSVPAFATAATGKVHVDNLLAHKSYDIVPQGLLFIGGFPERRDVANSRINVQSSWDNGLPLTIGMGTNHFTIKPGTQRIVDYNKDHHVEFIYSDGGNLVITAIEGSYHLIMQRLNGMFVDVDEGDRITLTLDFQKGTFVMRTGQDNSSIVALLTDTGAQRSVPPDHSVNFRIAADGTVTGSSADGRGTFLFGGAGFSSSDSSASGTSPTRSGAATPGGGNGFGPGGASGGLTGITDPTRITENPVTP